MLDEKDLQAIAQLMDAKLSTTRKELMQDVVVLMDAEFTPKFNILAEGQQSILEKLVPRSRVDDLEEEVKFLKTVIRQMNDDIQELKKAQ